MAGNLIDPNNSYGWTPQQGAGLGNIYGSAGLGYSSSQYPISKAAFGGNITNSISIIGDSISNNTGIIDPSITSTNSQVYAAKGWGPIANSLIGNRYSWVPAGPTGPGSFASGADGIGFCLGGLYTDDIINGGYLASAIASSASVIVVHIGTNNVNRGDSSAKIMSDLRFIWQSLINAGKTVVATTILPRDSTVITGPKLAVQLAVNTMIREQVPLIDGVSLCDWYSTLLDSNGNAPSGSSASLYTIDGLHPNASGAGRLGAFLAPILRDIVPVQPSSDWLPNVASDVLTPNPFGFGNVSGMATSWLSTTIGSPTSLTPTMVARTDLIPGQWQQVACTANTVSTDGWNITVTDSTSSTWTPGAQVFAACELQADAAGWDCRGLQLDVVMTGVTQVASTGNIPTIDRTALITTVMPAPTGGLVMVTPRIIIPTGVTAVRAVLRFYGSGTVRFSRFGTRIAI